MSIPFQILFITLIIYPKGKRRKDLSAPAKASWNVNTFYKIFIVDIILSKERRKAFAFLSSQGIFDLLKRDIHVPTVSNKIMNVKHFL